MNEINSIVDIEAGAPAGPAGAEGTPIIRLAGLGRIFATGGESVPALSGVDLEIRRGDMVAIMGPSGAGKSTLMNILGCLDTPTEGHYLFDGRDISSFTADELAELRREHFGFIFQRYQLLPELDAVENVEIPAVYAGADAAERRQRAEALLTRLGLGDRLTHRPNALSGGQQQRVSVARALMNGGEVILADEPTGALDSRAGAELLALLDDLHRDGHTIIIVTHDPAVAERAERIVEISDGRIVADRRLVAPRGASALDEAGLHRAARWREGAGRLAEATRMALRAMSAHKLRTFLTMLGIIIGIASVVSVVALGQGSQQAVLERISAIGTNTINIFPGSGFGDRRSGRVRTLVPADAEALAEQPYADSVSPRVSSNQTVISGDVSVTAQVEGVGADYFRVSGADFTRGIGFSTRNVAALGQDAVIDDNAATALFPNGRSPLGEVIIVGNVPMRVIGVIKAEATFGRGSGQPNIYVPYTTAMTRILGRTYLQNITVRVADGYDMAAAESEITVLLTRLHGGRQDFFLQNTNTIRDTIQSTSQTLTLLISMIAVISLIVGGIGVMNIMLVSVSERTKEIGIRMAVGARRSDILRQFLIEAVLVCMIGGVVGVGLAFGFGAGLTHFVPDARLAYSIATIVAAFVSSSLIGVIFGFMPARSAARLDPVEALARE